MQLISNRNYNLDFSRPQTALVEGSFARDSSLRHLGPELQPSLFAAKMCILVVVRCPHINRQQSGVGLRPGFGEGATRTEGSPQAISQTNGGSKGSLRAEVQTFSNEQRTRAPCPPRLAGFFSLSCRFKSLSSAGQWNSLEGWEGSVSPCPLQWPPAICGYLNLN